MSAVSPEVSAYMAELARRRAAGRDMRAQGRLGGKPRKPRPCPKCGVECETTREAGAHCRVKRKVRESTVIVAAAVPPDYTGPVLIVDDLPERVESAMIEMVRRVRAQDQEFAAFERANGPWVSPEAARQAWAQLLEDRKPS